MIFVEVALRMPSTSTMRDRSALVTQKPCNVPQANFVDVIVDVNVNVNGFYWLPKHD